MFSLEIDQDTQNLEVLTNEQQTLAKDVTDVTKEFLRKCTGENKANRLALGLYSNRDVTTAWFQIFFFLQNLSEHIRFWSWKCPKFF